MQMIRTEKSVVPTTTTLVRADDKGQPKREPNQVRIKPATLIGKKERFFSIAIEAMELQLSDPRLLFQNPLVVDSSR